MATPIYTADNSPAAYQLDWSYCIFWKAPPQSFSWFDALQQLNEKDHIRLLKHHFEPPNVSKFLISTQSQVAPQTVAQRVKGRLQHLIRDHSPNAFRRNYSIRGLGSTRRQKLEQYLSSQLTHHPPADPRVLERLQNHQYHNPQIDLSKPRKSTHAVYWYNLHIVISTAERWMEIRDEVLNRTRRMILRCSNAKGHLLSHAAILPDHLHLLLGCRLDESPQDVALAYLNNLAFAHEMKPVFQFGFFAGTTSEYDLGAIPRL